MSSENETLAKMLEDWSASAKDAAQNSPHMRAEYLGRAKLLDQAAALIRSLSERVGVLEGALGEFHALWESANDSCDKGGFVEDHIIAEVASYTANDRYTAARSLLCDLVEKFGRRARAALGDA